MKIKNYILTFALAAFFMGGATAQTSFIIAPEIGIHNSKSKPTGDLDLSSDFQDMDVNYSGIFSYQGGIALGIEFGGSWALMTGLKFNRKGGEVTVSTRDPQNPFLVNLPNGTQSTDVGEVVQSISHNWLSIPLLARAQFGNSIKVGLAIGPQFNMAMGKYKQTVEYSLENTNLSTEEEEFDFGESTGNMLKKNHMSLLITPFVSYEFAKNNSIRLAAMWEAGSNMVNDNFVVMKGIDQNTGQPVLGNVNGTMKNAQFGVMLSYEFRIGIEGGKY